MRELRVLGGEGAETDQLGVMLLDDSWRAGPPGVSGALLLGVRLRQGRRGMVGGAAVRRMDVCQDDGGWAWWQKRREGNTLSGKK